MASEANPTTAGWHKKVLETAPDAMLVVGRDSKIIFANRQTEILFGWPSVDLVGRKLDALIPKRMHGAHGAHVARFFESPTTRPMGSGVELVGLHESGREIVVEVSLSPVHTNDGQLVAAAIRDLSERKQNESALQLLARRLETAVESIQHAFALFDGDHRLAICNSAFRTLAGDAPPERVIGRSYQELLDDWIPNLEFSNDDEARRFRAECAALRDESTTVYDVRTKGGQNFRVTERWTPEGGIVRTIRDLTEDVGLAEELRAARTAAEAANAAKSEFLASMSHELRTPMNAVLGFAQLLRRDKQEPLSARHFERVTRIVEAGDRLLGLIDDILELSRIEAKHAPRPLDP